MNKTLSIALAGFSFIIDEHAYIKLGDYLNALRSSLDVEEADEVMHDIEIRMVEIFKETLGKREVINDFDVEKVIAQIGTPEKIEEQEEAYYSEKTNNRKKDKFNNYSGQKQLMRDPESAKIAGVCAGFAHYTGMDISLMRFIWIAIFIAGIFTAAISSTLIGLLYIIFWIVLPQAQTASDFLKMKGKPMNFDNLKEESGKIVQFANESSQKVGEMYNESKPYINKAGSGIWNVIRYILGAIFALMALSLLLGSFAVFGFIGNTGNIDFFGNIGFYLKDNNMEYITIAFAFLSAFIPALIFGYIAIKLLSPKTKFNYIGYVFGGLVLIWLVLISIIGYTAVKQGTMYTGNNEEAENVTLNIQSDTIMVDVKKVTVPSNFKAYWNDIYSDGNSIYKEDHPYVEVIRKDVTSPYLIIKKEANGYNQPLNVIIPVEVHGNTIFFPNYIQYNYDQRFRDYDVDYELIVPPTTKVMKTQEYGIYLTGDTGFDDDDDENTGIIVEKNKITINGSTIEYNSNDKDSIIYNGKKYPKIEAEKIKDSLKKGIKNMKNLNIKINDDNEEVSIKTKSK